MQLMVTLQVWEAHSGTLLGLGRVRHFPETLIIEIIAFQIVLTCRTFLLAVVVEGDRDFRRRSVRVCAIITFIEQTVDCAIMLRLLCSDQSWANGVITTPQLIIVVDFLRFGYYNSGDRFNTAFLLFLQISSRLVLIKYIIDVIYVACESAERG